MKRIGITVLLASVAVAVLIAASALPAWRYTRMECEPGPTAEATCISRREYVSASLKRAGVALVFGLGGGVLAGAGAIRGADEPDAWAAPPAKR